MKSYVPFNGKGPKAVRFLLPFALVLFTYLPQSWAIHDDIEKGHYTRPALIASGTIAATYFISEMSEGPALYAGIYAAGSLYLMNEWYADKQEATDLVIPLGFLSLAIANAALLSDEDEYNSNDIFVINLVGISALAAYGYWEHKYKDSPESLFSYLLPFTDGESSYLLTHIRF